MQYCPGDTDEAAILRGMHRGELEARVLAGERAQASAPPDVSGTLRLTAQAEADTLRQSADAEVQQDATGAASAKALAAQLAAERKRLQAGNARYETWSAGTATPGKRPVKPRPNSNAAGSNQPPGQHRDRRTWPPGGGSPRPTPTLWTARSGASARPPPPTASRGRRNQSRKPGMTDRRPLHPDATRSSEQTRPPIAGAQADPEPDASEPETPAAEPGLADDGYAARLDELQARADQAARRIDAHRAELDASSEHTARIQQGDPGRTGGQQAGGNAL